MLPCQFRRIHYHFNHLKFIADPLSLRHLTLNFIQVQSSEAIVGVNFSMLVNRNGIFVNHGQTSSFLIFNT